MATKRPHAAMNAQPEEDDPVDPSDGLMFLALGGGNEVGRSCHIIQYKGKTVMLDAGVHPALDGLATLPFYDEFDLSTVDILLITHFHMDHAASLPYVLSKTNFTGKVYMTHPTKAIYKWMMQDSVRVQNTHTSSNSGSDGYINQLFNEQDILSTLPLINTISFHTTHTVNGIRFTPYPAGHVLGACMYLIEIAGLNILFTGDYSRETDRHLIPAAVPRNTRIDCLITESTFGISTHVPRAERESALMKCITSYVKDGGRCLLPVPAIGNAQELMLILEDYWNRHAEFQKYPIYYASALARKCMVVYQTYIEAMNQNIRSKFQASQTGQGSGPWDFQFIRSLRGLEKFEDVGGCVMLASPGMLQNGVSRSLLERWAPNEKNAVIITGYNVEGTMARKIQTDPDFIPAIMTANNNRGGILSKSRPGAGDGAEAPMIPRKCKVHEFSFAAHVDGQENREFIEEVDAPVVILVHGERHNMTRLRSRLLSLQKFKVYSPANCEEVRIPFRREKVARVVGRLASQVQPMLPSPPKSEDDDEEGGEDVKRRKEEGQVVSGVLVQNDFKLSLMAPEDLREYAGLTTTTILCRQKLTLAAAGVELVRWALEGTFGTVSKVSAAQTNGVSNGKKEEHADEELARHEETIFEIMGGAVRLICRSRGEVELEWEGNATNDGIADSVMAVLLTIESSPAAVRQSSKMHHQYDDEKATNGISKKTNPFANITPEERLSRLFMFLEAQFGEDAITPIAQPKLTGETDDVAREKELARLHQLGIPVPGLEIRVDKMVAKVWLERAEVECGTKSFGDRVRAVVERAMETVAPLWQ
ncbi:endoribonuclease ysh1 [Vermiconidia calcicola]|uniref:Endoribonuclease ysh1 n=1 Tax=Vermiconidia calcicola TaxID=1690605 RepID=A0ACC3P009_9PEZI|nr:endoribonuclease ysh1 [Vermiconidia calcicola]